MCLLFASWLNADVVAMIFLMQSWMNSTLCDVKRDLAVPLRRDVSIAHAFISRGEETTD